MAGRVLTIRLLGPVRPSLDRALRELLFLAAFLLADALVCWLVVGRPH